MSRRRDTRPINYSKLSVWLLMVFASLLFWFMVGLFICDLCHAEETQASWYSVKSVLHEGNSGVMSNGQKYDEKKNVCASWDYPLGSRLKVTSLENGKVTEVEVCDRGPARRLYRQGRKLDLSRAAFSKIASLEKGVIKVTVEKI